MAIERERLVDWLRLLVDASAVTGDEQALAGALADQLATGHDLVHVGDSLVIGTQTRTRPCVALVGHLDVVPPTDQDRTLRLEDRDGTQVAVGRGTSDMHSGNAVALELFTQLADAGDERPYDVLLVLYAREEGPADDNELADVLDAVPWLADLDLAIVLEPTDGEIQAGCLGGLHAEVTFTGQQAHSARPWHGRNALTAAGPFLAGLDALDPVEVDVDGIMFRDVWSATMASTSNARNVIPGEFVVNLNLRFAPSRTAVEAERELRDTVARLTAEPDDVEVTVEVVDVAPPAPPHTHDDVVQALLASTGATVAGKQAWTDVARFAQLGVAAVNYGPGRTDQAHQRGEWVEVDTMVDVAERLHRFLTT